MQALDWKTLHAAKDSFLDPELALHPADLLYAVDRQSGGTGYVPACVYHLIDFSGYQDDELQGAGHAARGTADPEVHFPERIARTAAG
ncbi:MAG: Rpn family recombination-promoting nuclease/putative transposase, partial [Candidatus Competibacter phosphatis]